MAMADKVIFKVFRGKAEDMPVERHNGYVYFTTDEGKLYIDAKVDGIVKRTLINDNKGGVLSNTKLGWNSQPSLISEKDVIYVYTDYQQDSEGHNIPGIKIGDGQAYLIDIAFSDEAMMQHINNKDIHVTPQQKQFWNNKIRCQSEEIQDQRLIFTIH